MADHAVTQSSLVAHRPSPVELVEPPSPNMKTLGKPSSFGTPLSQASTAADFGSPMLRSFMSLDLSDFDEDVFEDLPSPAELPFLLLSGDPAAQLCFVDAKEELVKSRHCPDAFDWGVFELLSPTHSPSKDTMTRFSSGIEKPINIFTSSRAESACKGVTSQLEGDDFAMWLLSGSPVAMSYFTDAKEEFVKMPHGADAFDEGVFELLSPTHAVSKDTQTRFSSDTARPIHVFNSSRAEAACKGETHLENEDLALWFLSGSPAAVAYCIGEQEEYVKMGHCPDTFDWRMFELLSETQILSEDTMSQFSSSLPGLPAVYSSSRAEAACKGNATTLENEDLASWLLSGNPAAAAYFIGAQEEFVKTPCPDSFDWDVFELLSESHTPSEDILKRFPSSMAKPVHTFSSSRAEFACQSVSALLEDE